MTEHLIKYVACVVEICWIDAVLMPLNTLKSLAIDAYEFLPLP